MNVYLQANFGKKILVLLTSKWMDLTLQDVFSGKLEGTDISNFELAF